MLTLLLALLLVPPADAPRERCTDSSWSKTQMCTMLFFDVDSAEVVPSAWPILDMVIAAVEDHPGARLVIVGYTDTRNPPDRSMALSREMANNTRDFLVDRGIDPKSITVEAYGSANPRVDARPGEAELANRRVEVWVAWK